MKPAWLPAAALLCLWGGSLGTLPAQTPKKPSDQPHVRISETGWGPRGELVLAVRIHAGNTDFLLGSFDDPTGDGSQASPKALSLKESTLMDTRTGKTLAPVPTLIKKPYFGPSGTTLQLSAKGWVQLGIAFPHPPFPGRNAKGEPNPYLFTFQPPQGLPPVTVEIPFDAAAEAAAQTAAASKP